MSHIKKTEFDSFTVSDAQCKAAMLCDLFAGHTAESLCMSDAGVAGLCSVLRDISDVLEQAEVAVSAPITAAFRREAAAH